MQLSMMMMPIVLVFAGSSLAHTAQLLARQQCGTGYRACHNRGSDIGSPLDIEGELSSIYVGMLGVVAKEAKETGDGLASVCCVESMQCLAVEKGDVPFCYDKFTTNFFLPDGSYGSIVSGEYMTSDGSRVNVLTGAYILSNGTSGNLYDQDEAAKPNTAELSLPTPFTGKGVGGPIAASTLGDFRTYESVEPTKTGGSANTSPASETTATANGARETASDTFAIQGALAVVLLALRIIV